MSNEKRYDRQSTEDFLKSIIRRINQLSDQSPFVHEEDDQLSFRFILGGEGDPGVVSVAFYPENLAEWARVQSLNSWKRAALACFEQMEMEGRLVRSGLPDDHEPEMVEEAHAEILAYWFVQGMVGKIQAALGELAAEAILIHETVCRSIIAESGEIDGKPVKIPDYKDTLESFSREQIKERKAFLRGSIESWTRPRWNRLSTEYERLRPIWEDAKDVYKQNQSRLNWREIVAVATKDREELPPDLIASLSGKVLDIPEDLQEKWSEKFNSSKPADLALEHAARMCGAQPYSLTTRRLYQKLGEAKARGEIETDEAFH